MKYEILEPVLNSKGESYWLTRSYKDKPCPIDNTPVEELIKDTAPIEQVAVYALEKQGLWRCRKCGKADIQSKTIPTYCIGCKRDSTFDVVTKIINPDLWKLPKWQDIPVENIDMLELYNDSVVLCKKCLVFVEDIQYKIYVLWIISTYKLDSWNTVGTPFFVGLHNAGKTKGLDVIRELA